MEHCRNGVCAHSRIRGKPLARTGFRTPVLAEMMPEAGCSRPSPDGDDVRRLVFVVRLGHGWKWKSRTREILSTRTLRTPMFHFRAALAEP